MSAHGSNGVLRAALSLLALSLVPAGSEAQSASDAGAEADAGAPVLGDAPGTTDGRSSAADAGTASDADVAGQPDGSATAGPHGDPGSEAPSTRSDAGQVEAASPPGPGSPSAPADPSDFDPFAGAEAELSTGPPTGLSEAEGELEVVPPEDSLFQIEGIEVTATRQEELRTAGGGATLIDEKQLEAFQYDDPNQVLSQVPGLYVRSEDGYGLRPNIGLRGVSSDRSKKVTLLEDGVLFAPAPYTASAAYYFPLMSQVTEVEVLKGPGALAGGPHTVAGTVDLRTRAVPDAGWAASVDGSAGSYRFGSAHGYLGFGAAQWGLLGEFSHLQTNGFKDLDGGGNTGFSKQEGRIKLRVNSRPSARAYQRLELKLGYAREHSNETYLGLSDLDFRDTPLRRYAASQRDNMDWWRSQGVLRYSLGVGEWDLAVTLYRHDFDRLWERFNGIDGANVYDVLRNESSGQNTLIVDVLAGEADSLALGDGQGRIELASNQRRFVSEGIDARLEVDFSTYALEHSLTSGVRFHYDEITRDHTLDYYTMQSGDLVGDGETDTPERDSTASTFALAAFVVDELRFLDFTLTPGVRAELIFNQADNRLSGENLSGSQHAVLAGVGGHYAITDALGLLLGVHQGFSPAPVADSEASGGTGAGGDEQADPERAVNYEGGARFLRGATLLEAIGFFNDYSNILTTGAGGVIRSFNGGGARVFGVECSARHAFGLPAGLEVPVTASYTYQHGEFTTDFASADPTIGRVTAGDELTYLPPHQLSASSGLRFRDDTAAILLAVKFMDAMRERPGQGSAPANEATERYTLIDLSLYWRVLAPLKVFARLDNLTNARPLAARRPLSGARPIKPLTVQAGAQWEL